MQFLLEKYNVTSDFMAAVDDETEREDAEQARAEMERDPEA